MSTVLMFFLYESTSIAFGDEMHANLVGKKQLQFIFVTYVL